MIKVEGSGPGDDTRTWVPPVADDGTATYYLSINRNKRSVVLDLADPADLDVAHRLAGRADVLVENVKPGGGVLGSRGGCGEESPVVNVTPGLAVVDKPSGLTSHDVVGRLRRILRTRRIGHAGTLDPMATGVLVCGVGRATKLLGHLALDTKAYTATIRLGAATSTDDAEGELIPGADPGVVPDAAIAAGIAALTGEIMQVPSSVSAIKIDGKRAYARVRAGEDVVLPARPVTVSAFTLLARRGADLDVVVECTSGTYVRALARDLGAALGVGGHLTALRRTRVGPFVLDHARTLEDLEAEPELSLSLDAAVAVAFPRRDLDDDAAADVRHGRPLPPSGLTGVHGVFDAGGRALALMRDRDDRARPVVVLAPADEPAAPAGS